MAIVGEILGIDIVGSLGSQGYGGTQIGIMAWALAKWLTSDPAEAEKIRLSTSFAPRHRLTLRFTYSA